MAGYCVCGAQELSEFTVGVCKALGADDDVAIEVARHLVRANLSGHDSHGMQRLPQYAAQVKNGNLLPDARPVVLRESAVTAVIDARRGFGHFSTAFALSWAMERAREHGLAAAAVRHSTHIGRLGEYSERAGEQGFISMVTVGWAGKGIGAVVPFGGRQRFLGTNPWSIGVPAQGLPPMVYDAATSVVAEGKVRVARARGVSLPPGYLIDSAGNPSTNPADLYAGGALLPLGGEMSGHKGYGLAMASALIGGLAMIDDSDYTLASAASTPKDRRGEMSGVFLAVINPAFFGDAGHYRAMVKETLTAAGEVEPAAGYERVLVPGEPEVMARARRAVEGIALPESTWQELGRLAEETGVPLPAPRRSGEDSSQG